jgi:hypothetical protein
VALLKSNDIGRLAIELRFCMKCCPFEPELSIINHTQGMLALSRKWKNVGLPLAAFIIILLLGITGHTIVLHSE